MFTLLLFIVTLASGYYLLMPFVQQRGFVMPVFRSSANGDQDLEYNKQILLREIKDIEFDYDTGKLDTADYQELTQEYKLRAASLMRQMDTGHPGGNGKSPAVNFCAQCGDAVPAEANFCASCGSRVRGGDHEG